MTSQLRVCECAVPSLRSVQQRLLYFNKGAHTISHPGKVVPMKALKRKDESPKTVNFYLCLRYFELEFSIRMGSQNIGIFPSRFLLSRRRLATRYVHSVI